MRVFLTETLNSGGLSDLWSALNESGTPAMLDANSHHAQSHDRAPTAEETRALERVLAPDRQLYWTVRSRNGTQT